MGEDCRLAGRASHPDDTIVKAGNVQFGGKKIVVIAGPCSIESERQLLDAALAVKKSGASVLRGGAFKPRTSPYSFQGLGIEGLEIMKKVKEKVGLVAENEVMDTRQVGAVAGHVDILHVGARNAQNFDLLKEVGKAGKPVILKNGIGMTADELLMSAEYVMSAGTMDVVLCLRGIRTAETATRFTLDLGLIPVLKRKTHLPVIVDPSHAAGEKSIVPGLSRAAVAAGADGLMVEVHPNPEQALSDRQQQLTPGEFSSLMAEIKRVAKAVGRDA